MNEEIVTERVKARWSTEETALMAAKEAELQSEGVLAPNAQLTAYMPGRTQEAVKGKRRQAAYKSLVTELVAAREAAANVYVESESEDDGTLEEEEDEEDDVGDADDGGIAQINGRIPYGEQELDIRAHIENILIQLRQSRYLSQNNLIRIAERALVGENVDGDLERWLKETIPNCNPPKGPKLGNARPYVGSRYEQQRSRYARLQSAFKKCRKDAARMVLQDTDTTNIALPAVNTMLDFWGTLMSDDSEPTTTVEPKYPPISPALSGLWRPIVEEEVKTAKVSNNAAAGPDGIDAKVWTKVALRLRTLFLNLLLLNEHLPDGLRSSRTIFLAKKKEGSTNPGDFRPISITSVVQRHFHKILAQRFTNQFEFDARNSAYQHFDGVGKSVALLRAVIDTAWNKRTELHLACLDAAKAFNSVTYDSIKSTMAKIGCAPGFTRYVASIYENVSTTMQFEGTERTTAVGKGVLQGDPLSGPIFMAVFQCAIERLNPSIGHRDGDSFVNAVAYADDIVLLAGTRRGLQLNLSAFDEGLQPVGLRLNASKSFTLSLVPSGRDKKVKIETSKTFAVGDVRICPKGIEDTWKYLGLNFQGKDVESFDGKLSVGLEKISVAPLKPQQRMVLLREHVIPGVMHRLVLGASSARALKAADVTLRSYVRKWLHLPHDVTLGFFYSPQKYGGLGLPCLQHVVPLHRLNRYQRIHDTLEGSLANIKDSAHVKRMLHSSSMALQFLGENINAVALGNYWRARMLTSVDGAELVEMGHHKSDSQWGKYDSATSGSDYVHFNALRINSIPSRDRLTRGRKNLPNAVTLCRGGCNVSETTYHAIQKCHRSHGTRVNRHNRVVDVLGDEMARNGYVVTKERRLDSNTTRAGRRRQPDLIAVKDDTAIVLDAQVVYGINVDAFHITKQMSYQTLAGFDDDVRAAHGVVNVRHVPCTITYRGAWAKKCVRDLSLLGVSDLTLHWIVTSVLRGSWMCWRSFVTAGVSVT